MTPGAFWTPTVLTQFWKVSMSRSAISLILTVWVPLKVDLRAVQDDSCDRRVMGGPIDVKAATKESLDVSSNNRLAAIFMVNVIIVSLEIYAAEMKWKNMEVMIDPTHLPQSTNKGEKWKELDGRG